jgi:dihydroxyacetone kinase-like predicted kinase
VQSAKDLLDQMIDEDSEILTILKGEDAAEEEVDALISYVEEKYEDVEVEVHDGKQPLYSFIFSIE